MCILFAIRKTINSNKITFRAALLMVGIFFFVLFLLLKYLLVQVGMCKYNLSLNYLLLIGFNMPIIEHNL